MSMSEAQNPGREVLLDNERNSCHYLAHIEIFFSCVEILLIVLGIFKVIRISVSFDHYILIITAIVNMIVGLMMFIFPDRFRAMKYVLMAFLLLNVAVLDATFSYSCVGFVLVPAIASTRFYNRKMTFFVILSTVVILFLSSLLCYSLAEIQGLDLMQEMLDIDWTDFGEVIKINFLLKVLILLVPLLSCYFIAEHGKELIASQAEISVAVGSLETEIRMASGIQNQVLPKNFGIAVPDGVSVYASLKPAKEVGGDFYDFFVVEDKMYFLIGDVSDKGLYAAMYMMNIKNIIHSIALNEPDIENVLNAANRMMCTGNKSMMFVTLFMGCMDLRTRQGYYINAGHSPAIVKKADGSITKLAGEPQVFLGVFPNYRYKKQPFTFGDGDLLYLYTDGVTDALNQNEESFGEERLTEKIVAAKSDPEKVCEEIRKAVEDFAGEKEQFDDMTMLSLSFTAFDFDRTFPCDHVHIHEIADALNADLEKAGASADTIGLIDSALDDILDNIICYAYEDKSNEFGFRYRIRNGELTVVVVDEGVSFDPLSVGEPDLTPQRKVGGLGIYIVKNIMDSFEYVRRENENISILKKKIL